jgi:hypothetical protein
VSRVLLVDEHIAGVRSVMGICFFQPPAILRRTCLGVAVVETGRTRFANGTPTFACRRFAVTSALPCA